MSELGSGGGSSYPGELDYDNILEVDSPNAGKTKARKDVPNDLAAAVIAVQTTLGTDPAGSLANVKTFLQTEHAADGTHGTIAGQVTLNAGVKTDTISEKTGSAGVTVDGVLCKDAGITISTVAVDTITEKTGAAGVTIDSLLIKDGGISDGTNIIKTKVITIGVWDMDATASVAIAHGLTASKICGCEVKIIDDLGQVFDISHGGTTYLLSGWVNIDSTYVRIERAASGTGDGMFDSAVFNTTAGNYNRGWITITYVV